MTDISIQFHCLPEEIIPLVCAFVDEVQANVVVTTFPPFRARKVERVALAEELRKDRVDEALLTVAEPVLPAIGMMEFLDQNPGALGIEIGRSTPQGLLESALTARTSDPALLALWRKLANRVRSFTRTGVVAVNPDTGATAPAKDHRFSPGAKALERAGVPILAIGGKILLRLADDS